MLGYGWLRGNTDILLQSMDLGALGGWIGASVVGKISEIEILHRCDLCTEGIVSLKVQNVSTYFCDCP